MERRQISQCSHKVYKMGCRKCGIYIWENDQPIKTNAFVSYLNCSANKYLKHLRSKKMDPLLQVKQINQSTAMLLDAICEKFEYCTETRALGMYIFGKVCSKYQRDEKFWTAISLMVASKAIQLDKKVPYLNRYQRYADKSFLQEDYERAQRKIFEEMGFHLQYATFMTFLHFYMTAGVIFESDGLSDQRLIAFQDDLLKEANKMIRYGKFLKLDPEKSAICLIRETRISYGLQGWKQGLINLSGITEKDIAIVNNQSSSSKALMPLNIFNLKNRGKPINTISHSQVLRNSIRCENRIIGNNESKLTKISRQKFESTLRIKNSQIKQNQRQFQQPLSALFRSQNHSMKKTNCSTSKDPITFSNLQQNLLNRRC